MSVFCYIQFRLVNGANVRISFFGNNKKTKNTYILLTFEKKQKTATGRCGFFNYFIIIIANLKNTMYFCNKKNNNYVLIISKLVDDHRNTAH